MPPRTIPGPIGVRETKRIDLGTLARVATPAPGIHLPATDFRSVKEFPSKSVPIRRALGYQHAEGALLAQVFFATDDDQLQFDDVSALLPLIGSLAERLDEGFRVTLLCSGHADYRADVDYNMKLGRRRGESVRAALLKYVTRLSMVQAEQAKQPQKDRKSGKSLQIKVVSYGESVAAQRRKGSRPSWVRMMADRKVSVSIERFQPPVALAATGNWANRLSLEVMEHKQQGRIVALPEGGGDRSAAEERKLKNEKDDPLLPVALLETHYSERGSGTKREVLVRCDVIHLATKKVLFSAAVKPDMSKDAKEYAYHNPKYPSDPRLPKVERVFDPKTTKPPPGSVVKERKQWSPRMRALDMTEELYRKLKGSYRNITDRVAAEIRYR